MYLDTMEKLFNPVTQRGKREGPQGLEFLGRTTPYGGVQILGWYNVAWEGKFLASSVRW